MEQLCKVIVTFIRNNCTIFFYAYLGGRKVILSSPQNLRQQLEQKPPLGIQTFSNVAERGSYGASASFTSHPAYEDVQAANVYVGQAPPTRYGPSTREESYFEPANSSFMNYGVRILFSTS